ncbi:hypothetical protein P029_04420 [Anaplasma phagocytophilum str. Norway variant2]|uniref:Uncharacterized protein n=1 Tax=Anaplasma phagocytophilum str. Norway variant2 TaxID=1392507 RepID=A0A161IKH4_ANAPH|nr:hypothetical protein P029_04420 [Anaplasma phagocytophilum str. Norway variant2]
MYSCSIAELKYFISYRFKKLQDNLEQISPLPLKNTQMHFVLIASKKPYIPFIKAHLDVAQLSALYRPRACIQNQALLLSVHLLTLYKENTLNTYRLENINPSIKFENGVLRS